MSGQWLGASVEHMSHVHGGTTVNEVRSWLRENVDEGAICPACTQLVKIYKRPLTKAMATFLVRASRVQGGEWFHVQDFIEADRYVSRTVAGDFAKLKHWGLIEEELIRRPDGGRAGWWRLTELGLLFSHERVRVRKYVRLFDNNLIGFDGPEILIADAFRNPFDYAEIMANAAPTRIST
jgi:hypothetical protein